LRLFREDLSWSLPEELNKGAILESIERVLGDMEAPNTSLEDWRYGRVDELDLSKYKVVNPHIRSSNGYVSEWISRWHKLGSDAFGVEIVVEDFESVCQGVASDTVLTANENDASSAEAVLDQQEPFHYLSKLLSTKKTSIVVGDSSENSSVFLGLLAPDVDGAVFARDLHIKVPNYTKGVLALVREGGSRDSLFLDSISVEVGRDAELSVVVLQNLSDGAWDLSYYDSQIDQGGTLKSLTVSLGGDYSRLRSVSSLHGRGAQAYLKAGYVAGGTQTMEFRTFQRHLAPATHSDLLYKGAVAGSSHSIYSGLIAIEKGARGSNAFQTNRNIVLSESARADSVPNLDIQESDVRCSHASSVGPVDADQRFYLETKGITTEVAEKMIVSGFFRDLTESVQGLNLSSLVLESLERKW
jgi:Fe-S cluster assembly protein SufD